MMMMNPPIECDDTNSVDTFQSFTSIEDDRDSINSSSPSPAKNRSGVVTGRGITLGMLMADGIVESGDGLLTIDYLGKKFTADLMENGKIRWSDQEFNSPSAWAIHIKKLVNPAKKSGCGWASVKYKGKKLDLLKSTWFSQMKISMPGFESVPDFKEEENGYTNGHTDEQHQNEQDGNTGVPESPTERPNPPSSEATKSQKRKFSESDGSIHKEGFAHSFKKHDLKERRIVKFADVTKGDSETSPNTLVECLPFSSVGRMQPFTVSATTNCLLVMDFHCHLTTSEVVGYLAGKWDPNTQHMSVLQAFPCRCRLGDKRKAFTVEEEIRKAIALRGLQLVGWYHSHPCYPAQPSLKDIQTQMDYQLQMKGEGTVYQPCLAFVCSPFNLHKPNKESSLKAFWVMPQIEDRGRSCRGMPMTMNFNWQSDIFLTQETLLEMKYLVDFYKDGPDMVQFSDTWFKSDTFLDKLKGSLAKKFPKDQTDGRLLDYIHNLLVTPKT
ncbi:MPN domain-containing protein-like [Asterias amurensis]|uniref:MPN domain-containing protein-like n=1 Tax=Asterias amurensis TaxID=7602 RepID=UPI003AB4F033